ncbi:MAG TPA: DUF4362 domain-containing protein [Syntrophomonas sp.]|nr:DUF4362 domain-containing protein [Syntrophomonas sp.]
MYRTKCLKKLPWLMVSVVVLFTLSSCAPQIESQPELQSMLPQGSLDEGKWPSSQSGYTSEKDGWFIGSGDTTTGRQKNYVYLTHDGGNTWTETGNVNDVWPRVLTCGAFANDQIGFLCFRYEDENDRKGSQNFGRIYRTTDGGNTWAQYDLGLVWYMPFNTEMFGEVRSISFVGDSGKGTMDFFTKSSGDNPDSGNILILMTSDFGATWESVSTRPAEELSPLSALPADYSKDDAIADGVYVRVYTSQGTQGFNQDTVDAFYKKAFAGLAAFMRAMAYTDEGDPIITDYSYDGKVFTVTTDSTRDKFGTQDITSATYRYLVPYDHSHPQGVLEDYFLSNEQNIFTGTDDGGAKLREDLGRIPSPSDDVQRP